MIKTTFYIGLNDKDSKQQEISTIDAFKMISNIFNTMTEGATIKGGCKGIYKHDDGTQIIEETIEAFSFGLTENQTKQIVNVLKQVLNQESILVIVENVNSMFL